MHISISHRQKLYGLTADINFLSLLNQPILVGKIEQVFKKAINISINDTLYTLLSSTLDNAPNSCRLINKDFSLLQIKEGDSFYLSNKEFFIGDIYSISFSLCKHWQQEIIYFDIEKIKQKAYHLFLSKQLNILDSILKNNQSSLFNYTGENLFYLSMSEKLTQSRSTLIDLLKQQ